MNTRLALAPARVTCQAAPARTGKPSDVFVRLEGHSTPGLPQACCQIPRRVPEQTPEPRLILELSRAPSWCSSQPNSPNAAPLRDLAAGRTQRPPRTDSTPAPRPSGQSPPRKRTIGWTTPL